MGKSMYMNTENMKSLADSFNQKIKSLNGIYSDINTKMKDLDGTNDIWNGEKQKVFSQYLQLSLNKYPQNIKKLEEFHTFLVNTIENYEKEDNDLNKEINDNQDNFDV